MGTSRKLQELWKSKFYLWLRTGKDPPVGPRRGLDRLLCSCLYPYIQNLRPKWTTVSQCIILHHHGFTSPVPTRHCFWFRMDWFNFRRDDCNRRWVITEFVLVFHFLVQKFWNDTDFTVYNWDVSKSFQSTLKDV